MDIPKIINVDSTKTEEVKSALVLGFATDPIFRWIFPDPKKSKKHGLLDGGILKTLL